MNCLYNNINTQVLLACYVMGRGLSGLITVLEDKQHMVTVREKMNNIESYEVLQHDFLSIKK